MPPRHAADALRMPLPLLIRCYAIDADYAMLMILPIDATRLRRSLRAAVSCRITCRYALFTPCCYVKDDAALLMLYYCYYFRYADAATPRHIALLRFDDIFRHGHATLFYYSYATPRYADMPFRHAVTLKIRHAIRHAAAAAY